MSRVEIRRRRRLLDDFFKIDEVLLRHQTRDGTMTPILRRLSLERGDAVAAVLHDPRKQTLVLVRQFRYPTYQHGPGWLLEVVAGMVEDGSAPEQVMRREIAEETGFRVPDLELISTFYLTPGGSSERIFLFYGEVADRDRVTEGGGLPEEGEDIEVLELPVEEVWSLLDAGEIVDAKTLIGLLWLRSRLRAEPRAQEQQPP